jgi:uncharacterized protein
MRDLSIYGFIALILVIIGGINWLLVGLFDINIVTAIFGSMLGRLIFIIVGAAALYLCYLIYVEKSRKI